MSLLNERVETVLEGKYLVVDHAFNTQFTNYANLQGFNAITGALVPRGLGNVLLVDNYTGEPVQMPPNSVPVYFLLVPTVPFQSADLSDSEIYIQFYDNENFSNLLQPWGSDSQFTGEELQHKNMFYAVDDTYFTDFSGYPYIGAEVVDEAFTAGQVQVYIYYVTAQKPAV